MAKQETDLSRAFTEDGALKTHIGGQALIEGVMMRGKYNWAVGVRTPEGDIYTEEHDLASGKKKYAWLNWPFIRGCYALVQSLILGYKALEVAANHAFSDDEEEDEGKTNQDQTPQSAQALTAPLSGEPRDLTQADDENSGESYPLPPMEGDCEAPSHPLPPLEGDCEAPSHPLPPLEGDCEAPSHPLPPLEGDCEAPSHPLPPLEGEVPCEAGRRGLNEDSDAFEDALREEHKFSWKDDFGRPDTMIDALGAQRTLEVVTEPADESAADAQDEQEEEPFFSKGAMALSMALGLVLGIVLFIVAPAVVTNFIVGDYDTNPVLWNVLDGVIRVAIFVLYIFLIGRMSDIKRMFSYHGAEHKTIHCYEHGLPLTPENARSFPRLHVRCGTAFLIMVMIIAIFVYTAIPLNLLFGAWGVPDGAPKLILVILTRIIFMPVIAGISYEITVKWAGSHPENPVVKVILWPGLQMQYLTTNEPDDSMLECAIAAMQQVLDREEAEKAKPQEA